MTTTEQPQITVTRKFDGSRHVGYVVTGAEGILLATVTQSRRRMTTRPLHGDRGARYFVRCYISPDEYDIVTTDSLLRARDIAVRHAMAF